MPVCKKILRCSRGGRERVGLGIERSVGARKSGALVPPAGGLRRRRSACIFGLEIGSGLMEARFLLVALLDIAPKLKS